MRSELGNFEEETLGKPYDLKLIARLFIFIKPYRLIFYLSILLMVLITLLDLSIPYMTKAAIDLYIVPVNKSGQTTKNPGFQLIRPDENNSKASAIIGHGFNVDQNASGGSPKGLPAGQLLKSRANDQKKERAALRAFDIKGLMVISSALVLIVLLQFLFNFAQKLVMEIAGQKIMHDLRMHLFNHIQSLPVSFFNTNPVGRLVTRVTNDVQNLHEMFSSVIIFLFKDLFLIGGIALVLCFLSRELALVAFIVLPFVIYASFYFARHARDVFRELRVKVAQINTRFSETIQGIKVIQLFQHEGRNDQRFRELNHENYLAGMKQIHIFALFMPVVEVLASTALAVIIFYGGKGVISETITLGVLVAFISYMKMFFRPVRDLAEKFNILQNSMASAERIFLILEEKKEPETESDLRPVPLSPEMPIHSLEFSDVTFSYSPGAKVLKNISFRVQKGETIAVVGPTGAGKTSLINLFIRFYDPDSGRILINKSDIRIFDKQTIRSRIALVNQDPFLFSGSIRENILSGKGEDRGYTIDEILDIANCRSFVDRLPKGVDTRLSEGAATLSSGERQLISIARAISANPDLIILDEATSYIDTESEVRIQEALNRLMASRTSVIIAHRLSTAKDADTILVMNRGRIVESGTHDTLMAAKGLYRKLTMVSRNNDAKKSL